MNDVNLNLQSTESNMAKINLKIRENPIIKKSVYPWNNYDYDYTQFVRDNYSPSKLGISSEPCLSSTIDNITKIPKYLNALSFDEFPNNKSKPILGKNSEIKKKYKSFGPPYPEFIKEYPEYFPNKTSGIHSSSYFIHTGFCPTKIKDKTSCSKKGFKWIPNIINLPKKTKQFFSSDQETTNSKCYKPRYSYVDNSPGDISGLFKGILPSFGKNIVDLNPVSMMNIMMNGKSVSGTFTQLPCKETFINKTKKNINLEIIILLLLILIIFTIIKSYNNLNNFHY